ncbi:hypothetical protein Tco_0295200 [Tanacetum coccineum]
MKDDKQARDVGFPLWLALMYKFKKPASHVEPCRVHAFRRQDHEDHHDDDARDSYQTKSSTQEQQEEFDAWSDDQGTDDDKVPFEEVSPELMAEMSGNRMKWVPTTDDQKRIKEDLTLQIPKKPVLVFQSCKRDPNAPPMYLVNKDIFYLKNGNYGTRKYVLSLHKIHAFSFPENDLEELNTRWVRKQIKRFNMYAQYAVTSEGKFMKEIFVKRADDEYKSFSESDYNYLHKNDIEDMYLIKKPYTITSLPFVGLIYENSKKEKRIVDIDEIPKFCDATLKRVFKEVKKINLDVKHGYVNPPLSKDDAKFMMFYEEYIQKRLRHRDQMRRWENYVNGRSLQQR